MTYELLKQLDELLTVEESEKEASVSGTTAKKVYHRDYLKTRNKKYRKDQEAKPAETK